MKMNKIICAATVAVMMGCLLTGCTKKEEAAVAAAVEAEATKEPTKEPTKEATPTPTQAPAATEYKTIGEKTADALEIKVTNNTGKNVTAVSIKGDEPEYPASMLPAGEVFANGETRLLYCKSLETVMVDGKATFAIQTMKLDFDDNTSAELNSLAYDDLQDVSIKLDGNVAYVEYVSKTTQQPISTWEAEKAYAAAKEQYAAEQAAQQQAAQQAAAEQQAAEQAAQQTYSEPTYSEPTYSEPAYSEPSTGGNTGGGGNGCVTDGLTF